LGFDPAVIYYHRREREKRYGRSMWSFAKKLKYFIDSFVAFSYLPVRVSPLSGIGLAVLGIAYALVVVVARLFFDVHAEGWSYRGAQLLMIGVLG
jgi:polyisoprenyl-phosphate glycosyltransferase